MVVSRVGNLAATWAAWSVVMMVENSAEKMVVPTAA
jgi:hypothetical protein